MKPSVTFRRANENDTGELLVMMSRLCQMYGSVFNEQLSKTNLHKIINDESLGRVWVIFCDGVTAGYAVIASDLALNTAEGMHSLMSYILKVNSAEKVSGKR